MVTLSAEPVAKMNSLYGLNDKQFTCKMAHHCKTKNLTNITKALSSVNKNYFCFESKSPYNLPVNILNSTMSKQDPMSRRTPPENAVGKLHS